MANVYTQLLGRTYQASAGDAYVYTVDDRPTIVRDLVVNNYATSAQRLQVYVVATGLTLHLFNGEVEPNTSVHLDMRQRLEAADEIRANGSAAGWSVSVTGYRFSVSSDSDVS